jgi:mannitol-1-phosphate 5-dehydrogenase
MGATFVGFGFGPVQSGLFVHEAARGGGFERFVISEIDPALLGALRDSGGRYMLNVAHDDRVEHVRGGPVELLDPRVGRDRRRLLAAIADADVLVTALGSVGDYTGREEPSVADLLAEGLLGRRAAGAAILYAAENDNRAAEILAGHLRARGGEAAGRRLRALDTVIPKVCGAITDERQIAEFGLERLTPAGDRAVLVEAAGDVLAAPAGPDGSSPRLTFLREKRDLRPFAEAKLYGHNAAHALIAYLAGLAGLRTIAEAGRDERIMAAARRAYVREAGAAMIHRHGGSGEALFTPDGWRRHAEDILHRMACPNLHDPVSRVGRDAGRKLGWDDRLFGAMRLALDAGVAPAKLALGAAAGATALARERGAAEPGSREALAALLREVWAPAAAPPALAERLINLAWHATEELRSGRAP